jgi:hypothetical protein
MPIRLQPLDLALLDATAVDAYALFVGQDERPLWGLAGLVDWRLAGGLSDHLRSAVLQGVVGESFLTTTGGMLPGSRIFAFGLGPAAGITAESFAARARHAALALRGAQVQSLVVGLPERPPAQASARTLVAALSVLGDLEISVFGPMPEMAVALPELASRRAG